jgi:hypothetical protein
LGQFKSGSAADKQEQLGKIPSSGPKLGSNQFVHRIVAAHIFANTNKMIVCLQEGRSVKRSRGFKNGLLFADKLRNAK